MTATSTSSNPIHILTATTTKTKIILNTDQYLTHYWPFLNATMTDSIGHADMQQGMNTTFISDRFGCPNSSLNLNGGWTYVHPGVYFDAPQFTISVWIYPQSIGEVARVIDFGNSPSPSDNIVLTQDTGLGTSHNLKPKVNIRNGSKIIGTITSSTTLVLNQWQFLSATFDGTLLSIYINGVSKGSASVVYSLPSLTRTNNYIGKSWDTSNGYSSSYLDDLRFYNKSLSRCEIIDLMKANSKSREY